MLGLAAKSWGRSLWRNVTPEHVQVDRIVQQLCAAHLASDDVSSVARGIATSMVQRDTTWGETPEQEMRRQVMKSWEWEALMRALFRLERASGVTIHTPYLSERLWRWGVWLDALDRLDSVKGRLYNKFLLRCAHGAHAHLFPEGFARRGKAAVFDAHLGRGMMGTEHLWIEEVLQAMERGPRQKIALQQWEQVRAGTLGRPLVELCRTLMTERWRLALVDSTGNRT